VRISLATVAKIIASLPLMEENVPIAKSLHKLSSKKTRMAKIPAPSQCLPADAKS
jgi:hypothetical protein